MKELRLSLTPRGEHILRMSENRALRGIFGPKREEVADGWGRRHNEELHNLYASPNFIRVIKSRRMRWAGHVVRMEEMRKAYTVLVVSLKGRDRAEDVEVNVRMILEFVLWK
jgi:hypothetical protein